MKIKFVTTILAIFVSIVLYAQNNYELHGYTQIRLSSDYRTNAYFSVRRAKLWIAGAMPATKGTFLYKTMAFFQSSKGNTIQLLDAKLGYKYKKTEIWVGQQVPDFSYQRSISDYKIFLPERANVVIALIPGAETSARDIGMQVKYKFSTSSHASLGIFNGNGANLFQPNKQSFMITHRMVLTPLKSENLNLSIGYSAMYRKADNQIFKKIYPDNRTFNGSDMRYGFETRLFNKKFNLQTEYIAAYLDKKKAAYGTYALIDYRITPKTILSLSADQFKKEQNNEVWYMAGITRQITAIKSQIGLTQYYSHQNTENKYLIILQYQYMFN